MNGHQLRILVAEDEKALAQVLKLKLTMAGFAVVIAENGVVANKLLESEPFDLVLLDLVMPNKDGFAVLADLATKKNHPPVVVLSNLGQDEDRAKVRALGVVDYWVKADISLEDVVARIRTLLNVSP